MNTEMWNLEGLSTSTPQVRRAKIRGRDSWTAGASDPPAVRCRTCNSRRKNATAWNPTTHHKPDPMVRRPDYLGLLGRLSSHGGTASHRSPRPATPRTTGTTFHLPIRFTRTALRVHDHDGSSLDLGLDRPTDARPPGRLSPLESNGPGEPLQAGENHTSFIREERQEQRAQELGMNVKVGVCECFLRRTG